MVEAALAVPPAVVVLAAAMLVVVLPRLPGHAIAAVAMIGVVGFSFFAPAGDYLVIEFIGFDVVVVTIDPFTRLLGFGFGFLGSLAVVYTYASGASRVTSAFAVSYVGATLGVTFAGDWLTLLFFWELMAVTSTLLVWHYGGDAVRAGFRYAIAHGIGGALLMFAVTWHFVVTGSFVFTADGGILGIAAGGPALLAVLGIGVNCAFIGLHTWLPDTYPRPHFTASVFLSVFTTKSGAYVLYRAFPEGGLVIAYMGGAMAVYGVVYALLQHDMRALLSYHIQAQVGYMVAGIGIGSAIGIAGAMGHLFNNVLYKALLFMAVGVIIYRTGENDLYKLGGLWRRMPLTAVAYAIGALSITAVPGFNGFISKGMILDAANPGYHGAPEYQVLYWLLLIGAVGTFLSFIKLGYYAFIHGEYAGRIRDATAGQAGAMLGVGGLCIVYGVWWQGFVGLLPLTGDLVLEPYSTRHLLDAVGLATVSVIGFVVIKGPLGKIGHVPDMEIAINPVVFHTGRFAMLAVTDTYARADRGAKAFVRRSYWMGSHPMAVVLRLQRRLPFRAIDPATDQYPNGGTPSTVYLRANIGLAVLLITLLLTMMLWLLLL